MAVKLSQVFGKAYNPNKRSSYTMLPKGVAQPHGGGLPQNQPPGWAVPSKPPAPKQYTPPSAGGQGPVAQPPQGPDTSYQDSTYNNTTSNIKTGLDNLQGYLTNSENDLGLDYGVQFDRDPNDPLQASNFRIDPNVDVTNPFSRAALLNRTHQQNTAGNTNSYAARGQLYAGSLQNAQDNEGFGYQAGQNALKTDFAGRFGGLYKQWLDAQQTGTQQELQAQADAIARNAGRVAPDKGLNTGGAAAPGANPNQYPDSNQGGKQPSEKVSQAVKDYLAQQKKANPGKSKKPVKGSGKTGGARAPGGKR